MNKATEISKKSWYTLGLLVIVGSCLVMIFLGSKLNQKRDWTLEESRYYQGQASSFYVDEQGNIVWGWLSDVGVMDLFLEIDGTFIERHSNAFTFPGQNNTSEWRGTYVKMGERLYQLTYQEVDIEALQGYTEYLWEGDCGLLFSGVDKNGMVIISDADDENMLGVMILEGRGEPMEVLQRTECALSRERFR
jgi:hypothetical protein